MLTKDGWIEKFEEQYGRKPLPKEFIEAKNNGEFETIKTVGIEMKNSQEEPVLESVLAEEATAEYTQMGDRIETNIAKMFCYNCGQANQVGNETCRACGTILANSDEQKSFFTDLSAKLAEVGALAKQKTQELTKVAQMNSQIHSEKKKRAKLIIALGNAYYEQNKSVTDSDFKDLITQISETDHTIQYLQDNLQGE